MCGGPRLPAPARPAGPAAPGEMNHTPPAELERVAGSPPLQTSAINHQAFLPSPEPPHLLFYGFNLKKKKAQEFSFWLPGHPSSSGELSVLSWVILLPQVKLLGPGSGWGQCLFAQIPLGSCTTSGGLEPGPGVERRDLKSLVAGDENRFPQKWTWARACVDA